MQYKIYMYVTVFGIVTAIKDNADWTYYASIILAAIVCYAVTYFRERSSLNTFDWKYSFVCSFAASFLAYYLWPSMKDWTLDLILFKAQPFSKIQVFVGISSFFGVAIFNEADLIKKITWKKYLSDLGTKLKAIGDKKS